MGYLELRRTLGFGLVRARADAARFITYLEDEGSTTVTAAGDLVGGATGRRGPQALGVRLSVARGFAAYLHTLDPAPRSRLPAAAGPLPPCRPYLYSASDICRLLEAAPGLRTPLKAATIERFQPARGHRHAGR